MSSQHEKFLQRLKGSVDAVFVVARWLYDKGYSVEVPVIKYADNAAESQALVDEGDIIIDTKEGKKVIEVKHLGVNFTCVDDWPFKNALVASASSVDRNIDRVASYICVSKDMTHGFRLDTIHADKWSLQNIMMKNTGNFEAKYVADLEWAVFFKF